MAKPVEAKFCMVVKPKLLTVIFIYPMDEGGQGAAHNFNCPPYKPGMSHVAGMRLILTL